MKTIINKIRNLHKQFPDMSVEDICKVLEVFDDYTEPILNMPQTVWPSTVLYEQHPANTIFKDTITA